MTDLVNNAAKYSYPIPQENKTTKTEKGDSDNTCFLTGGTWQNTEHTGNITEN